MWEMPDGKCPVCEGPTKRRQDSSEGTVYESEEVCPRGCYAEDFSYGSTTVRVGFKAWGEGEQTWGWSYTEESPWREIEEFIKAMREDPHFADRLAFQEALAAKPLDMPLRLVYADWLDERGFHEEASLQREWARSWEWMEDFAKDCGEKNWEGEPFTAGDLVQIGKDNWEKGENFYQEGSDVARDAFYQGNTWRFWHHWGILTGTPLSDEDKDNGDIPFCCSC